MIFVFNTILKLLTNVVRLTYDYALILMAYPN